MYAIDAKFVMQVWRGREAGHADITDVVALAHAHADFGGLAKARHVRVQRRMAAAMVSTVKFNKERMLAATKDGFLNATDLADYLVTRGQGGIGGCWV